MTGSNSFWFANPGQNFYNGVATQSLRFGVNNVLTNEQDAPSDRKNFTLSMWFKRNRTSTEEALAGGTTDNANYVRFESSGAIRVRQYNTTINLITNAVYRDTSAWYHLVVAWDLDNSSEQNDRVIIYVNGTRQTLATNTLPSNTTTDSNFNVDGGTMHIGGYYSGGVVGYYSGYIADVNFVDGTTLAPTAFGEDKNGVWIPKKPTGLTYGNNGFRLQFKNSAVTTASDSTIGADTSGKDRHFTSAGIVASDCNMPDSPENNFCTMNSNANGRGNASSFSEGNLKIASTTGAFSFNTSTFRVSSGKWYFEMMANDTNAKHCIGISGHESINTTSALGDGSTEEYSYTAIGQIRATAGAGGAASSSGHTSYGNQSIIGVAMNLDDNELQFFLNGSSITTIDITAPSATTDGGYGPAYGDFAGDNTGTATLNCGQDPSFAGVITAGTETPSEGAGVFKHAPPSGFLALCTANISDDNLPISPNALTQATDHFKPVFYSGLNSTAQDITVGFKPDLVWIKTKTGADISNMLYDSNRGATKFLQSDAVGGEGTGADSLTDFDVSGGGFSLGADSSTTAVNNNGKTYISWNWKGGTNTTNDASSTSVGDRDSVFQANTTAGFSIVTYTGSGVTGGTPASRDDAYAHGLGVVPEVIICKNRDLSNSWLVGATAINNFDWENDYLHLNDDIAHQTNAARSAFSVAPTDTVFSVGEYLNKANAYVAYLFASVEGYSKFGSYVGNGSATDGTYVFTGFDVGFVMVKNNSTGSWTVYDNARNPINNRSKRLVWNLALDEADTSTQAVSFFSNGFKTMSDNSDQNAANAIYFYMAFSSSAPFKYANGI